MDFWIGIVVGLFAGANFGVIVAALLVSSKRRDHADNHELEQFLLNESALDDIIHSGNQGMGIRSARSC